MSQFVRFCSKCPHTRQYGQTPWCRWGWFDGVSWTSRCRRARGDSWGYASSFRVTQRFASLLDWTLYLIVGSRSSQKFETWFSPGKWMKQPQCSTAISHKSSMKTTNRLKMTRMGHLQTNSHTFLLHLLIPPIWWSIYEFRRSSKLLDVSPSHFRKLNVIRLQGVLVHPIHLHLSTTLWILSRPVKPNFCIALKTCILP